MNELLDRLKKIDVLILLLWDENSLEMDENDDKFNRLNYLKDIIDMNSLDETLDELMEDEIIVNINENKAYKLTDKGKKRREDIWNEIKDREIILVDNEDTICLRLEDLREVLDEKSIIEIIKNIENDVLDLRSKSYPSNKLVGREDELKKINDILEKTMVGVGNTLFIKGDKGIGKTRLVYEIKEMGFEKNFDFLRGGSLLGDYNPYRPFKDALKKLSKIKNERKAFSNIISDIDLSMSDSKDKEMFDAQRKSIFYETTKYIQKLSEFRPLVIFLDDLQWADKGTLNLLDYMSDKLQDYPVFFIGAYRPGDVHSKHPLKETMNRMSRKKLYDEIELEQLDEEDIEELIKILTDIKDVPDRFTKNMKEKTKGNPLFIEESVKQMLKDGLICKEKSQFPNENDIVLTSDMVQDVISRRITNFDDETRKVLQLGSVIGKKIPFELLSEACKIEELELLEIIDSIMESRLWLEHTDEESFVFYHDLFVETIYDGLGKWLERKNLHKKVAQSMEEVYNDLSDKYSKLAYHYKNAERYAKAAENYCRAGKRAEEVYSHEDAVERYKESIKMANLSKSFDDSMMFDILENLSDALDIKGEYEEERMYLKQAMSKTEELEDERRIYRKISKSYIAQGNYKDAINMIKSGLSITKSDFSGEDIEVADEEKFIKTPESCKLLSVKGWVMMRLGKYREAKDIFKKELAIAEKIDHKPSLSQAYHDLGSPARSNIDPEKSIEYLNKSIEIRDELIESRNKIEDKLGKSKTLNNLGAIYSREGKLDKALDYFKRSIEIDDETNIKLEKGRTLNNIGYILIMQGKLNEVSDYLDRGQDISEKIGDKQGISRLATSRSFLHKEKGEFANALDSIEKAIKIAEEIEDIFGVFMSYKDKADLYLLKGEIDKAKNNIEKAEGIASKIDNDKFRAVALSIKGHINRTEGDYQQAIENHKEAISLSEKNDEMDDVFENRYHLIEDYLATKELEKAKKHLKKAKGENLGIMEMDSRLAMVEGILKREKGRFEEAQHILKKSLDKTKLLSKKYRIARIYYELGKLHRMRDEGENAQRQLNRARDMFEEMNMNIYQERCNKELNEI
ncbi:MAG: tetratricopeptide repeat protein [Thermoplasmata archaeon]